MEVAPSFSPGSPFRCLAIYQVVVRYGSNTALLHQLVNPVTGLVDSVYSGRRLFYLVRNSAGPAIRACSQLLATESPILRVRR